MKATKRRRMRRPMSNNKRAGLFEGFDVMATKNEVTFVRFKV